MRLEAAYAAKRPCLPLPARPNGLRALSDALIRFDDLACRRGHRLLWRGVSGALGAGQALHVTGANGIGKSSLIRILAGLLPPAAGHVARSADAAMIDEAHALDRDRTVAEALLFWAAVDGCAAGAVEQALERLEIGHLTDVPVRFLSTGQRKRAGLARVVASDAPLWLLDEPGNGLDRDGIALLEALIAAHRAGGGAVVVASHLSLDLADAAMLDLSAHIPSGEALWADEVTE